MYDATLERFFTQDRFAEKYYSISPYQYAANNPIALVDINGNSIWISYRNERILYEDGNLYTVGSDGNKSDYAGRGLRRDGSLKGFLGKTVDALGEMGTQMFNKLKKGKAERGYVEFASKLKSWKKYRRCIFTKLNCDGSAQ